jgi:hypothetical protein
MDSFSNRLKSAWNVFRNPEEKTQYVTQDLGYVSSVNPGQVRLSRGSERSIISTITTKIAMDVASFNLQHVRLDNEDRYLETIKDSLNHCLTVEANKDQTGRAFIQDIVMSMFDEGVVAIIPVDTMVNPTISDGYRILSLRTGKIKEWFPNHVRVEVYDDNRGVKQTVTIPKSIVGIIENPLYAIMNEPNSTLQRLKNKLGLLDVTDDKMSSGKLDLIIQLPYTVKSETRKAEAKDRVQAIANQLEGSRYGIAYADATERITQLNRPIENNLLSQVQYLTTTFYNQLGMSEAIFTGKATEPELRNYYDRTVEPIVTAIVDEMIRKFLTKTARTQGHSIMGFRDIFRLVPASELANIADVFSRNAILTSNELRQIIGRKPSNDPRANELTNKNMPEPTNQNGNDTKQKTEEEEDLIEHPPTREEVSEQIERLKRELKTL